MLREIVTRRGAPSRDKFRSFFIADFAEKRDLLVGEARRAFAEAKRST